MGLSGSRTLAPPKNAIKNMSLHSTNKAVVVGCTHLTAEVNIGFVRAFAGEDFFLRIPLEFAAAPQGNDDQVPDAGRAVAGLNPGHGVFARADAVEEIPHVIIAHFQPDRVIRQRSME